MCTHTYNFGSVYKALSMPIPLTFLLNSSFPEALLLPCPSFSRCPIVFSQGRLHEWIGQLIYLSKGSLPTATSLDYNPSSLGNH